MDNPLFLSDPQISLKIESTSTFLLSFVKYDYASLDKDIQKQKFGFSFAICTTIIILLM